MIVKGLGFGVRLTLLEEDILSGYGETVHVMERVHVVDIM